MEEIELSKEAVKALLSETKLQVMNALKERKKTVSELSEELKLSKSTLHQHLQELTLTGLILRNEDERKWVYYELSRKGRKVIEPSQGRKIVVFLSLTFLALLIIALLIFQFIQPFAFSASISENQKLQQNISSIENHEVVLPSKNFEETTLTTQQKTITQEDINKSDENYSV